MCRFLLCIVFLGAFLLDTQAQFIDPCFALKPTATELAMNGSFTNTIIFRESCRVFKFQVPADNDQDVKLSFSFGDSGQVRVVPDNAFQSNHWNPYFDWLAGSFQLETETIPMCALQADATWYVLAFHYEDYSVSVGMSAEFVPSQYEYRTGVVNTPVSGTAPTTDLPVFYTFNYNATTSKWISLSPFTANYDIHVDATTDICAAGYMAKGILNYKEGETNEILRFQTEGPVNDFISVGLLDQFGASVQFQFTVTAEDVVCQVAPASSFTTCTHVTWPISVRNATASDEFVGFLVNYRSTESAACLSAYKEYLCGIFFPRCDSNNFPRRNCPADCEAIENTCSNNIIYRDCSSASNNYCYVSSSSQTGGVTTTGAAVDSTSTGSDNDEETSTATDMHATIMCVAAVAFFCLL